MGTQTHLRAAAPPSPRAIADRRDRLIETGIVVAGTGYAGAAIAKELTSDPRHNAPFTLLDKSHGEMLVDVILSESGVVAGALVARGGKVEAIRAPVVILATGNVGGLFPGGDWRSSGDGLAIAHRAGLPLTKPHLVGAAGEADDPDAPAGASRMELRSSVPCKSDGSTALPGLFVAGSLGSDRPAPERVAKAAIQRSREGCEPLGPYRVQPAIDAPLPTGFTKDKFDRLRAVVDRAVKGALPVPRHGPDAAADALRAREKALVELHRLKGEADEYARARVDLEMFSFQNACEVGILLLKSA